jgi:hypothetical protein
MDDKSFIADFGPVEHFCQENYCGAECQLGWGLVR